MVFFSNGESTLKQFLGYREEYVKKAEVVKSRKSMYLKLNSFSKELTIFADLTDYASPSIHGYYGIPELAYSIGKKVLAETYVFFKTPRYQIIKNPKVIYLSPKVEEFTASSNDFLTFKPIFSYLRRHYPVVTTTRKVRSGSSHRLNFGERLFLLELGIPESMRKSLKQSYSLFQTLSYLCNNVKKLGSYSTYYDFKKCVHCSKVLDPKRDYNLFNLPICRYHKSMFDYMKIGRAINSGEFSYNDFCNHLPYRRNYFPRTKSFKSKCRFCGTWFNRIDVLKICYNCRSVIKKPLELDIALGLLEISDDMKGYVSKYLKKPVAKKEEKRWELPGRRRVVRREPVVDERVCLDCSRRLEGAGEIVVSIAREHREMFIELINSFCTECYSTYNWNEVRRDIERGNFVRDAFLGLDTYRRAYRREGRAVQEQPSEEDSGESRPVRFNWNDQLYTTYFGSSSDETTSR